MRTVLVLLLLANLTLFAYTRLDTFAGGEPARIAEQVDPAKVRILSAKDVAALGPTKAATLADVCLEWGPFGDYDRARALADLAPLNLGTLLTQRRVDVDGAWSPTLGPFPTRPQVERRLAEVRARGVADVSIVDNGRGAFVLVFGAYRTEAIAAARAEALVQAGVAGARPVQRTTPVSESLLVVRDPAQPVVNRLRELQAAYPGTDLRAGTCERTS